MSIFKKFGHWLGDKLKFAAFLPLLPFKGIMKKSLKKKGVNTKGMSFPNIVVKFHTTLIKKPNGLEGYDHLDADDLGEGVVMDIVKEVIKYIKSLANHVKEKGADALRGAMSDTEIEIGRAGLKVQRKLEQKELKEIAKNNEFYKPYGMRKKGKNKNMIIIIVIGALAIYFLFIHKK